MTYNKIQVAFGALRKITGPALQWQYNEKQILVINGLDLPNNYAVDFCNKGDTDTVTMPATAEGVEIPDQFLLTGRPLTAYIVVVDGESVNTIGEITFPVNVRGRRTDISPEPVEQQQIDALIGALNEGVTRAEDAAELLENCSAEAETLSPGSPATAEYDEGVFHFGIPQGQRGETGPRGETGERGEKGDTGDTGPKGEKGDKLTYADLTDADKADLVQGPILEAQTEAVQVVNTAGDTQTERVNQAGTTQTNAVNQAGTTQVAAVNQAGVAQVAAVEAEGTDQVGAVIAKGAEVLDSIPDDYTELQHHVDAVTIYETSSGAIASFEDGADALPMKSLVANIEPVQDLHGYDNPWPAGGGKNKLQVTGNGGTNRGITAVMNNDGTINVSGANDGTTYSAFGVNTEFQTESGVNYILSGAASSTVALRDVTAGVSDTGRGVTIIGDGTAHNIQLRIAQGTALSATVVVKPMIRLASETDATFAPYSNICPISGHTWAEIEHAGKNLCDDVAVPTTQYALNRIVNPVYLKAGLYTISFSGRSSVNGIYVRKGNSVSFTGNELAHQYNANSFTFTADKDGYYFFQFYRNSSSATWEEEPITHAWLELGSTATDYEEYRGNKISVTFPSEAGTVYGGTLTLNPDRTGTLVVDRAGNSIESLTWTYDSTYMRFKTISLIGAIRPAPGNTTALDGLLCSAYKTGTASQTGTGAVNGTIGVATSSYVYIRDEAYSDVDSWIADYGTDIIVYPLVEPVVYTLTESEISDILTTLYGTNNIWADTGDTEATYPADTKLFIEKLTQPTEDDMTADHAISAGTFFMLGNSLYLATSQIAAGGTITPGTNATKLSLADALNQINA